MNKSKKNLKQRKTSRITRKSKAKIQIARKLYFFLALFFLAIVYVGIYQVYDIKYVSGKDYETQAIYNQVNRVQDRIINPNRGAILDRNKQALAVSTIVYRVVLDVRTLANTKNVSLEKRNQIFDALNKTIGISLEELNGFLALDANGNLLADNDTNYKIIERNLEYSKGMSLKEQNLACVYLEEDTKRIYPHNSLAAQLIGFINGDSNYNWGLENYYNEQMTGVPGRIFRTYEADNSIVTRQEPAQEGYSLVTTIDQTIQQYAEKAVKSAYYEYNAENTAAIVMNPNTGEIIAMASYPTFNLNKPNELSLLERDDYKKIWSTMESEEQSAVTLKSWRNFNVSDTFEPGSIFKPVVVAAALEEGVITENDIFYCNGIRIYGDNDTEQIPCHNKSGHGTETLEQVLANSCNVGMMDIAVEKLGREKFYKYQREFGFGEKTGIDLPAEANTSAAAGLMYDVDRLNVVELASGSMGQGFNCTSLQAMNAFAAVINGGNLMKPYVVSQIIDKDGNLIEEHSPEVVRKVISESTSDYMRKAMQSVISPDGTGKKAIIEGYALGGKTGTAQQGKRSDNIHTCSFIAYLPVENPELLVGVFIHKPTPYVEGVTTPAPTLKEIMLNIINYKAIPPSYTSDSENTDVNSNEVIIEDYTNKSLQETIKNLNGLGIDFELVGGSGDTVTRQFPSGGGRINKSAKILLYISAKNQSEELVIVPDVVDMNVEQAKSTIEAAGFLCDIKETQTSDGTSEAVSSEQAETDGQTQQQNAETQNAAEKKVIEQYPAPEVKIEKGTIIKIIVK